MADAPVFSAPVFNIQYVHCMFAASVCQCSVSVFGVLHVLHVLNLFNLFNLFNVLVR